LRHDAPAERDLVTIETFNPLCIETTTYLLENHTTLLLSILFALRQDPEEEVVEAANSFNPLCIETRRYSKILCMSYSYLSILFALRHKDQVMRSP